MLHDSSSWFITHPQVYGWVFLSYLVGSIPTGYLLARFLLGIDIRQHGSGNIGATNIARTSGKRTLFVAVFALDACKALGTLYVAQVCMPWAPLSVYYLLAFMILVGNAYSCFIGFTGGKGVATLVGILAALFPVWYVIMFSGTWLSILALAQSAWFASLGSLLLLIGIEWYQYVRVVGCADAIHVWDLPLWFLSACFVWLFWRHKHNIITSLHSKL